MAASWGGSGQSGAGWKIGHHAEQTRNSCMFPGRIICCCWDICVKQSDPPPERPEEKNVLKPKLGFIQVLKSLPVCLILMEESVFHLFHFSQPVWKEAPLTVIMELTISSFPARDWETQSLEGFPLFSHFCPGQMEGTLAFLPAGLLTLLLTGYGPHCSWSLVRGREFGLVLASCSGE